MGRLVHVIAADLDAHLVRTMGGKRRFRSVMSTKITRGMQ